MADFYADGAAERSDGAAFAVNVKEQKPQPGEQISDAHFFDQRRYGTEIEIGGRKKKRKSPRDDQKEHRGEYHRAFPVYSFWFTLPGKIVLAICALVILITALLMTKYTKPIEYKR